MINSDGFIRLVSLIHLSANPLSSAYRDTESNQLVYLCQTSEHESTCQPMFIAVASKTKTLCRKLFMDRNTFVNGGRISKMPGMLMLQFRL